MPYVDPDTVHTPVTATAAPAAWGTTVRDDLEFLIDPPVVSVFGTTGQTVTANTIATATPLNAAGENYDNDGMHSTVSLTSRLTVQTPGRYEVIGNVNFAANATGFRYIGFLVNATSQYDGQSTSGQNGTNTLRIQGIRTLVLAASDYVECVVAHNNGSTLTTTLDEFVATYLTR